MTIETLRNEIDKIDTCLVRLLNTRYECCIKIGELKKEKGSVVLDSNREKEIIDKLKNEEWYPGMVEDVWPAIMKFSKTLQFNLKN